MGSRCVSWLDVTNNRLSASGNKTRQVQQAPKPERWTSVGAVLEGASGITLPFVTVDPDDVRATGEAAWMDRGRRRALRRLAVGLFVLLLVLVLPLRHGGWPSGWAEYGWRIAVFIGLMCLAGARQLLVERGKRRRRIQG